MLLKRAVKNKSGDTNSASKKGKMREKKGGGGGGREYIFKEELGRGYNFYLKIFLGRPILKQCTFFGPYKTLRAWNTYRVTLIYKVV